MGKLEYHQTQLGLGLKQSSLGGTFYPNVSKNHKIQLIFTVGELEWVPALTVTSPVQCFLIIPDHERRALFLLSSHQFRCPVDYGVS